IDHVIMGNALQTSADAIYGARHVGLKAGVRDECPALTVNRLCGSGLQSVASAGQLLKLGEAQWVLAGGMGKRRQAAQWGRGARGGADGGGGAGGGRFGCAGLGRTPPAPCSGGRRPPPPPAATASPASSRTSTRSAHTTARTRRTTTAASRRRSSPSR